MRLSPRVTHEVRCPVHGFVRFNNLERDLINSAPMQRLKHVHQLAMTYQVYPGATHCRFEHSLGVMDLAGRAFDSLMLREKLPYGAGILQEAADDDVRGYWRQVLRLAALLHDTGHLPFSHATETELLPSGKCHEYLTKEIILRSDVARALEACTPPIRPVDVVKLAVKPKHQPENKLSPWEGILNEILNGDTFGVDRIDYLLRDSHHAGVAYGRFDPLRLLDSLLIVPSPASEQLPEVVDLDASNPENLTLGIQDGGIQGRAVQRTGGGR